jgi:hypothetical protein
LQLGIQYPAEFFAREDSAILVGLRFFVFPPSWVRHPQAVAFLSSNQLIYEHTLLEIPSTILMPMEEHTWLLPRRAPMAGSCSPTLRKSKRRTPRILEHSPDIWYGDQHFPHIILKTFAPLMSLQNLRWAELELRFLFLFFDSQRLPR